MAETVSILPSNLILDQENPRLVRPNEGQRDTQRAIGKLQQRKLLMLAKDIVEHGLSPSDLPIVMPAKGEKNRYVVLEGNRRLAALKSLENPDSMVGSLDPSVLTELRKWSQKYQESPIDLVQCAVVKNQQEARHWIELRHTGENQGAGTVPWDTHERQRFLARVGTPDIVLQALDLAEQQGRISADDRSKVPATSLKRLLGTPEVRDKLGLALQDGTLKIMADKDKVAKAIAHVANDLATGKTKTKDIYTQEQRTKYAAGLPKSVAVKPTLKNGKSIAESSNGPSTKPKPKKPKKAKPRDYLIPSDCILNISDQRCSDIEDELRTLSLENHPNAISVLLRVFLELSTDAYIASRPLTVTGKGGQDPSLSTKLKACAGDLLSRAKLDKDQAKAVDKASDKNHFLAPSVLLMHAYVHSRSMFPAPGDLRASWSSLQPFVVALWS